MYLDLLLFSLYFLSLLDLLQKTFLHNIFLYNQENPVSPVGGTSKPVIIILQSMHKINYSIDIMKFQIWKQLILVNPKIPILKHVGFPPRVIFHYLLQFPCILYHLHLHTDEKYKYNIQKRSNYDFLYIKVKKKKKKVILTSEQSLDIFPREEALSNDTITESLAEASIQLLLAAVCNILQEL